MMPTVMIFLMNRSCLSAKRSTSPGQRRPPWPVAMRDDYYELLGIRNNATAKVTYLGSSGHPIVVGILHGHQVFWGS